MAKKLSPTSQTLFKEYWKPTKGGGLVLDYVYDKTVENFLRPALLEEIKPNLQLYRRSILKKNEFYPMIFRPEVSWFTICDIYKLGNIYIER